MNISKAWHILLVLVVFNCLTGCVAIAARTPAYYEQAGTTWGKELNKRGIKPGTTDQEFVQALNSVDQLDYFRVHSDLKEAFKKGFRIGYEDRIADLVLGPNITYAAGVIGKRTSSQFVNTIDTFEVGWTTTFGNAIEVFIVLISEGSQADRTTFIDNFMETYGNKYNKNAEVLKSGYMKQVTQGGTPLFMAIRKGQSLAALDVPTPESLKKEIYQQAFKVMGDEWGRRLQTNLIRRDELIDLLRRCKPVLHEVSDYHSNLQLMSTAFVKSYDVDGAKVFKDLLASAGYEDLGQLKKVSEAPVRNGKRR